MVNTWQFGGGVLLFAQTFVAVKPVLAGKLKDWADSGCPQKIVLIRIATARPKKLLYTVIFLQS